MLYSPRSCISPVEVPEEEWIAELFAETPNYQDDAHRKPISKNPRATQSRDRTAILSSDEAWKPPCDLTLGR